MRVFVKMLTLRGSELPDELSRLHSIPTQLCVSGEGLEQLMNRPRLAVIGSRKVTPYGRAVTTKLVNELAGKGVVIISGLALGIDSIAHQSCLAAGGQTIAVLPCGLDTIYPTSHAQLAKDIVSRNGLIVSEYPAGTPPRHEHFIARNRIIAGLAEGLLITEAALKSGSMHTAGFALEMNMPVMAVPGPITSATSEGTNNLIKTGATMVTSADDVLTALKWQDIAKEEAQIIAGTAEERSILELLKSGLSDASELHAASKLSAADFSRTLTMLELTGKIRSLGANHWALS